MYSFSKIKLQVSSANHQALILRSYAEFKIWYLQCHDLSIFSCEDIDGLLAEEKPNFYPCVPLLADDGFETFYLSLELVKCWIDSVSIDKSENQRG